MIRSLLGIRPIVLFMACALPLFAYPGSARAAVDDGSFWARVHGGLVGRLNFASLVADDIPDDMLRTRTGFSLGGFVGFPASHLVTIQTEATYTRKGGKLRVPAEGYLFTDTYTFDYLEVAPLLQVALPLRSDVRVFGEVGPVLGAVLSGEVSTTISDGLFSESLSGDVTDELEPIEFGLAFGAGVAVPMEKVALLFGIRYHLGLTTVSESFADTTGLEPFSRNLQLQTGLIF